MTIQIGDKLPDVTFMEATENGPEPRRTEDIFAGKTVALFAVPGAFTPTCSVKHLPSFLDHASSLKDKGVDEIICTAVNDAFVLGHWAASQNASGTIRMLADGNGAFAKAIGLELDASGFGMGSRSQRYSMLVEDGVVKQLNVEDGAAFEVSSGDYLLGQL
ncbi:MAG: peroxiredoxin [Pseudomonadota bacterium]